MAMSQAAMAMMKKILVIEDEPQTRDIFLECLEGRIRHHLCENGRERPTSTATVA